MNNFSQMVFLIVGIGLVVLCIYLAVTKPQDSPEDILQVCEEYGGSLTWRMGYDNSDQSILICDYRRVNE